MSTLTSIGKRVDAFFLSLDHYRAELGTSLSTESVSGDALKKQLSLAKSIETDATNLNDALKPEIDKLVLKLDHKDPVTGALRYGDASKTKILGFANRVNELIPLYAALQAELSVELAASQSRASEIGLDLTASGNVVDIKLARMQAPPLGPIRNIDSKFQNISEAPSDVKSHEMSVEDRELEEKARLVRERKAQEAEHAKNVLEALSSQLAAYTSYFNSIRDLQLSRTAQKGTDNLLSASIALLGSNDNKVVQDALSTVLGILERIISRPDDVAARRLRVTHPVLKQKLTGVLGGVELLAALGFQARVQKLDAPADPKVSPVPLAALESSLAAHQARAFPSIGPSEAPTTVFSTAHSFNYGVEIFDLLGPATLFDVHLEMQEPSLDSLTSSTAQGSGKTDKLSWLDWFDSLGNYKTCIEQALIDM